MNLKNRTSVSRVKTALVVASSVAVSAEIASAASIGLNFIGDAYGDLGQTVTADAYGVALADWTNGPESETGTTFSFGGGLVSGSWTANNDWATESTFSGAPGADEVNFGYADDSGDNLTVTLSGLSAWAASEGAPAYTIQFVQASPGATGFTDTDVFDSNGGTLLSTLTNANTGVPGATDESGSLTSDTLFIDPQIRAGSLRGTIAGIIIRTYTGVIFQQPVISPSDTVFVGTPVTITVGVGGSNPTNQWYKDSVLLPGETNTTLNLAGALGDAGVYYAEASSELGAETSDSVTLTVNAATPPVITEAPVSQSLYQGYPATFTVAATGPQLSYQWKSNTVPIPGETNTTYTIASITSSDAATYTVEVSNPDGSDSASATLTVEVPTGAYEAAVVNTKPMLWFRYSESGPSPGNPAFNSGSLGAAGDGSYIGSVMHPVAGALVGSSDEAAAFSGGTVSVPFHAAINPAGPFTVDCWINPDAAGTGLIVQSMINGENAGNTTDRTGWALRQNGTGLRFLLGDTAGAPYYYYYTTGDGLITPGVWQHVAVSYNDIVPTIYVNGIPAATVVTRQDGVAITQPEIDALRIIPNFAAPLLVGDRGYGGWSFAGSVDEVAVYPSALTSGQLLAHYDNGTNASPASAYNTLVTGDGAVEYLRLNEPALVPQVANSGTLGLPFDGFYNGDIAPGTVGPRPATYPGLESDNTAVGMTNGYTASPALPINTDTVTVTCWLKPETIPTSGDIGWPAWLGNGGGMHIENSGGRPQRELRYHWAGGAPTAWAWGSGLVVPADTWTFCALVVEPDKATIYMSDGGTLLSSVHTATHPPINFTETPGFGGNQAGRADRTYIGEIDESTVYDRALSPAEISGMYALALGELGPSIVGQPQDAVLVLGDLNEDITFAVQANGLPPLSYQWKKDGVDLPGATNGTLVISNASPADVGTYTVSVSTVADTVLSDPAELILTAGPVTPSVYTTLEGDNVTFGISMPEDSTGYTYQWQNDGGDIAGATGESVTLTGVVAADSGIITVDVTLGPDMATSDPAELTVLPQPTESYLDLVIGHAPSIYWRLGDAFNTIVAVDELGVNDGEYYTVGRDPIADVAVTLGVQGALIGDSNTAAEFPGTADSKMAFLDDAFTGVLTTPSLSVELWALSSGGSGLRAPASNRDIFDGDITGWTFYATDAGTWQWRVGDGTWSTVEGGQVVNGKWTHLVGTYDVDTGTMNLFVNGQLVASQSGVTYTGQDFNPLWIGSGFNEDVVGSGSEFWVGKIDEVAIYDRALPIDQVQEHYAASLGVGTGPVITGQPASTLVLPGAPVTMRVGAQGLAPITYQWQMDTVDIPGATGAAYDIAAAGPGDVGVYRCVVANPNDTVTSDGAALYVYGGAGVAVNFWDHRVTDTNFTGQPLAPVDVAGLYPMANWDNAVVPGDHASGDGVQPLNPTDQDGAPTTMDVRWSSQDSWRAGASIGTPDEMLAYGYLDDGDIPDPNLDPNNDGGVAGDGIGVSVTVSNVPYSTYAVVLYLNSDQGSGGNFGTYTVNGVSKTGGVTDSFTTYGSWVDGQNVLTFFSQDPTVEIRVAARADTTRTSLAGFQIIDPLAAVVVPPPITLFEVDPAGGTYSVTWDSIAGTAYKVESATDLVGENWGDEAGSTVTATGDSTTHSGPVSGDNANYRVIENPTP